MQTIPTKEDIEQAHDRIQPYIHRTPVLTSESLNKIAGCSLFLKCENFQKIGAFKMRGAANAIFSTDVEARKKGFAAHSSGNHGQAVALAARLAEVPAYIVMPNNSNQVKLDAVRGYGAEVTLCEPNDKDRQQNCDEVVKRTGAELIHPFEDYRIVAGQATASKELIEEIPDLDIITCPIGGGGLAAGSCLSTEYFSPMTQVIGTEPEAVNDTYLSFKKGQVDPGNPQPTIADGLRTTIGEKTFGVIRERMENVLTVSEGEMVDAMKLVWERTKILIEPSSAVPIAAVVKSRDLFRNQRVGVIITGGNVDLKNLPFWNESFKLVRPNFIPSL